MELSAFMVYNIDEKVKYDTTMAAIRRKVMHALFLNCRSFIIFTLVIDPPKKTVKQ